VKEIYSQLSPASLDLKTVVYLVQSLLCDSVPLSLIFRKQVFQHPERPSISLKRLLANIDLGAFADAFIDEFERMSADREKHQIWRDNVAAFRHWGAASYSNCVIFGEKLRIIGPVAEVLEIDGFALPVTQLGRSGIELLRFARNAVQVALESGEERIKRIAEIVRAAVEAGSVVFGSPDVYTVDEFVRQLR
jgi:hypothetical protein